MNDDAFLQDPPRLANQWDDDALLRSHLRRTLPDLLGSTNLELAAVYTHFATADDPESPLFGQQRARFESPQPGESLLLDSTVPVWDEAERVLSAMGLTA